jgi:GNAT superfamily N-acetyltransferase
MSTSVVSVIDRPDLVEVTVRWRWNEWLRNKEPFEDAFKRARQATALRLKIPQSFVLLVDDEPVGTASITAHDLEERPDLTPWLAGVFVVPKARGQGYAGQLVAAVEEEARRASISTLWLYTNTAERIYARVGWRTVKTILHDGTPHALMRRDLLP